MLLRRGGLSSFPLRHHRLIQLIFGQSLVNTEVAEHWSVQRKFKNICAIAINLVQIKFNKMADKLNDPTWIQKEWRKCRQLGVSLHQVKIFIFSAPKMIYFFFKFLEIFPLWKKRVELFTLQQFFLSKARYIYWHIC